MNRYAFITVVAILLTALSSCTTKFQGSYKCVNCGQNQWSLDFNPDGTVDMSQFVTSREDSKGTYTVKGNHIIVDMTMRLANDQTTHVKMDFTKQGDALVLMGEGTEQARFERH